MAIGENMKQKIFNYKVRNALLVTFGFVAVIYFGLSITLRDIKIHDVEILEKSPLFPYDNYDYMITEEAIYTIDKKRMEIPAFFRTDFASIPQALWFIEAPYKSSFVYPAIWHDYMYLCSNNLSRKDIDDIFFSLLRYEQNSLFTSLKMYLAVRLFGSSYFNNNTCSDTIIQEEMEHKYKKENKHHG